MKITYPGPFEAVDVPSLDLHDVKRGETVEIPDAAAPALVAQGWRTARRPRRSSSTRSTRSTKPAAEKKADTAAPTTKAATAAKKEK